MHKQSGFFLLEILCALACMGIMWIILARSCVRSVMAVRNAQQRIASAMRAQNFLECSLLSKQEKDPSQDWLLWRYDTSIPKILNTACTAGGYASVLSFKCIVVTARTGSQEVTLFGRAP